MPRYDDDDDDDKQDNDNEGDEDNDANNDNDQDNDVSADNNNDDNDTSSTDDNDSDDTAPPAPHEAAQAVQNASPDEVDAHKGMLGEALGVLSSQGIDLDSLAQKYGLPHVDVDNLNATQIVHLTQQLAQEHPEVVAQVAQRFPEAQGLLGYLTGGSSSGGGGMLGSLLGRFLG